MDISKENWRYELELGRSNRKFFILTYFDPFEIWIDFKGLPREAFLCAIVDNEPYITNKCGSKNQHERYFVNIEWVINEWGGHKELVEAIKKRKQMIIDDLPNIKKKYFNDKIK